MDEETRLSQSLQDKLERQSTASAETVKKLNDEINEISSELELVRIDKVKLETAINKLRAENTGLVGRNTELQNVESQLKEELELEQATASKMMVESSNKLNELGVEMERKISEVEARLETVVEDLERVNKEKLDLEEKLSLVIFLFLKS